ncbi:GL18387 [Drosophila persimilis]|uniref:GL18387 n=1 Tax=Drosophila persimilis TaxID=7234 RepID=B4HD04_DROPE|nr:GL18387 [Drosophila persimilis]
MPHQAASQPPPTPPLTGCRLHPKPRHWQSFLRSFGVRRARYSALKLEKCASQETGPGPGPKLELTLELELVLELRLKPFLEFRLLVGFYDWR